MPDRVQSALQLIVLISVISVLLGDLHTVPREPGANQAVASAYRDSDLPPEKRAVLVFYCSNPMCRKAPNAARRAKKLGYENVYVMSAGISGWLAAKLPTESGM